MSGVLQQRVEEARAIERKIVHGNARLCIATKFGLVCKALWPIKTAEELAFRVGCTIRTAAYEISGERHPSVQSLAVIVAEITPPWK